MPRNRNWNNLAPNLARNIWAGTTDGSVSFDDWFDARKGGTWTEPTSEGGGGGFGGGGGGGAGGGGNTDQQTTGAFAKYFPKQMPGQINAIGSQLAAGFGGQQQVDPMVDYLQSLYRPMTIQQVLTPFNTGTSGFGSDGGRREDR